MIGTRTVWVDRVGRERHGARGRPVVARARRSGAVHRGEVDADRATQSARAGQDDAALPPLGDRVGGGLELHLAALVVVDDGQRHRAIPPAAPTRSCRWRCRPAAPDTTNCGLLSRKSSVSLPSTRRVVDDRDRHGQRADVGTKCQDAVDRGVVGGRRGGGGGAVDGRRSSPAGSRSATEPLDHDRGRAAVLQHREARAGEANVCSSSWIVTSSGSAGPGWRRRSAGSRAPR